MNKLLGIFLALAASTASVQARPPVDLTGMVCQEQTDIGTRTWEFYGDVVIRYYDGATRPDRLLRIGNGAYERYDREGNWMAVFYFFEAGDDINLRILARPGLATLAEDPAAPLEHAQASFNAVCEKL